MLSAFIAALAVLLWPTRDPITRLKSKRSKKLVVPQRLLLLVAGVAAWALAGAGALIAFLVLAAIATRVRRTRAAQQKRLEATEALTDGITAVVDELKAGAHAAAAATRAAIDAAEPVKSVLNAIAATARLGGDVHQTLNTIDQPQLRTALPQLAKAWHVSTDLGVPLADALDATRADLVQRTAFARQTEAKMAGPRASASVLAALPVFGLSLGQLSGANPINVLVNTTAGQALLVLGAILTGAGLLWTTGLTSQVVLR